ncbi:NAD-dependent epimerase/dehydratase family protein [[Leptolyngbya] sp. PCC 7376]|uniref:NAD-dependent epimerase/dehydratase family protein n=1 Tax=[Leptolyngbya] sp. PCC 7376 TaxID=111781 RepID=UPI00029EF5B1|nr:NAD(P)-dependent oxidoreductase [[Leptolyngbya] sp. PCC 7376]AFY40656.1 NAD-dependent epimerase/dehydratase family protein [[Leptolyngbya] sp. PCC 7376]
MTKKVFITGASGCIGHYLAETFIQNTDYELYLFVRSPQKLQFDTNAREGIHIVQGDLIDIEAQADLLKTMNVAILAATAWGGAQESFETNVVKTAKLIDLLDPTTCEQIIYFSTASLLGRNNEILTEARDLGTDYVRTKYECYQKLGTLDLASKISVVFPTLVAGGAPDKPYSHFSGGLKDLIKWLGLAKFFSADGSFHFIHGEDIATVVRHLAQNPPLIRFDLPEGELDPDRLFVLGNEPLMVDEAIAELCEHRGQKVYFKIPLTVGLANFIIKVFRIQVAAWDRFCIDYRHFTYAKTYNPRSFGLESACPKLTHVLTSAGVPRKSAKS